MKKLGLSSNALQHSGGLERYAMDLVRGFAAHGIEPAFFARRFDTSLREYGLVEPHRINVSFLPGKLRDRWFSWRLRAARREAHVDVLIGCNRVDSSDVAICGGTHLGFLRATRRAPKRSDRWQIALERRQYERAKVVVAHSQLMHDELRELYGVDEAKIRVLFPPVDGARFAPTDAVTRATLRRKYGFADDEIVLLFPSSSHERKGLPFIEAALRNTAPPVVVAVAGRPPARTSERLRYIGYVKELAECYQAADFTILASTYEPFGLVGIESVMCGTPVIFPSSIGCCDAIAPHAKFVFAPDDLADLCATLERAVREYRDGTRRAPLDVARDAVLYDPGVAAHVGALLTLARQIDATR
ncbi:glycosyltransferase family 4 protein [Paraburkholderia fungorum]|uniref:glycosyltransferase family 4 protein n=1 Tax=Paraburkholderia fungorum TaxID=134537 RepID=UPI0004AAE54D|nr:glycosyltransferase family 4 protein [Paraburkholderia fungorum]KFX61693.1 glycosyl transferase family 1 [Burkholderia sp. K24]MBU7437650.1 glycosyltransferase family 4 protein [Paraburkholderia fungorum]PZR47268.1 MAG: glycosyl transferase family 1 [Paraburkholderia fungorum]USX09709.1 glycosyltransferase family 4 protein [Paraburkholderia fungorum]